MRLNPESLTHGRLWSNEVEATKPPLCPVALTQSSAEAAKAQMTVGSVPEFPLS